MFESDTSMYWFHGYKQGGGLHRILSGLGIPHVNYIKLFIAQNGL